MNELTRSQQRAPNVWDILRDFDSREDWPSVGRWRGFGNGSLLPAIDVSETDDSYVISAELPGVTKEDIHVSIQDGVLTINAESKFEQKQEKDGRLVRQERRYGKYVRSLRLGGDVKEANVKAVYTDGILNLTIPKAEEAKPRHVEVKVS